MNEKQRRAKRKAAAKRCSEDRKSMTFPQKEMLRILNRTNRRLEQWRLLPEPIVIHGNLVIDEVGPMFTEDEMETMKAAVGTENP
jgi:hypothetical protein